MRANIMLDDKLIERAQKLTGIKTKREVVHEALRLLILLIDSLIATFCIENDYQLLHNDSDFDGYEEYLGLQVIHP